MADTTEPRLLVTGAGGNLGRRIVELLADAGVGSFVAASRDPAKLTAPPGVETRRADFDDPASLAAAFEGIDRVLLISTDRIDVPGLRITQHRAAVDAAREAGVKHVLYTSMLNPEGSRIPFAPDHLTTEQAIEGSGLDFTILRVSWYAENLLGSLPGVLASGKWFTSAGDGRINYVPRNDVARAAAAALASQSGVREHLDITGPAPLTIAQIATVAAELAGKPIEVVQVSDEDLANGARAAGVPEPFVPLVVATDANIRAGKFDVASDAVERLTDKPAQSVREYLAANKAALGL
jgi:NAD(P)H dehydrogenase (quinone)